MGFVKKWLIILVVLGAVAGALFYLGKDLKNASLEDFELNNIKDISTDSFVVDGKFSVSNPSQLSVPVKSIEYDIVLKKTDEVISSGSIPGFNLNKEEVTDIPFSQEIKWVPSAKLALDLLTEDEVYATVKGKIRINLPKVQEYELPFSKDFDIKDYVNQFADERNPVDGIVPNPDKDDPEEDPDNGDGLFGILN